MVWYEKHLQPSFLINTFYYFFLQFPFDLQIFTNNNKY